MREGSCDFDYAGYSLTAFYFEEDRHPIVTEIWYGDNNITELVSERVICQAHEACQQDIYDYDIYLYETNLEMRNDIRS